MRLPRPIALLMSFMLLTPLAPAQPVSPVTQLSGQWTTLDGAASHRMSAQWERQSGKGTLTVLSNASHCSIQDAPMTVTVVEQQILIKVDAGYTNPCRANVSVTLTPQADGERYEGELKQGGPAGVRFPVLRVSLRP